MSQNLATDSGWALETSLDVEWAHAIAPNASILLVLARSDRLNDLLAAVDYARGRSDVVVVSMSWGDTEFSSESLYDFHFTNSYGAAFFVSSGDDGAGVLYPASSPNVVAVGGTTLTLNADGSVSSETGWSGSGGGMSSYEPKPAYQATYGIVGNRRAVPDVAYNANPTTGFAVYDSTPNGGQSGWFRMGGTSAGAPQWAAIYALGRSAVNSNLYRSAKSSLNASYFRDITTGSNGAYSATGGYDYVTGLGSPVTVNFAQTTSTTSITLLPAGQSTPLSASNQFAVTYTSGGTTRTAYAQGGTLTLNADANTDIALSGTSTASTASERWVFSSDASTVSALSGTNLTLYYYDLLAQSVSYAVAGGGNPVSPTLSYTAAPSAPSERATPTSATLPLSQSPQAIWALRGSSASVNNPISGGASEQWKTTTASWTLTAMNAIPNPITYQHQFLLVVAGAQPSSVWYNSGETAQIQVQGVSDRASGTGQRTTSYSLDGGAPVNVEPTIGSLTVPIVMNAAHRLQINTVKQYQVAFDASASRLLMSATQPTISGDSYWYDEGTTVRAVLNGVGERSGGAGVRLVSFTVDGVTTPVAASGQVEVLYVPFLLSSTTVSAQLTTQYQLATASGSVTSVTPPAIAGDTGWYDAGTLVVVTYDYSWNPTADQSRINAVGYSVNQGASVPLERAGNGTFTVQVTMTQPETVQVNSMVQYKLRISGGFNVQTSQPSPTDDSFFDSDSTLKVATSRIWGIVDDDTRERLVSYTFDGVTTAVPASEEDSYTTPTITFNEAHALAFKAVLQHHISFEFKDASGKTDIKPTSFQVETAGLSVVDVLQSGLWLDEGAQFKVNSVVWEGADVKPENTETYVAASSVREVVQCRVFNAELAVQDFLGMPISGAPVTVTLVNQTTVHVITDSKGVVPLSLIPIGTFRAEVSHLGVTTEFAGDASVQAVSVGRVFLSIPMLGLIVGVTVAAVAVVVVVLLRRRRRVSKS